MPWHCGTKEQHDLVSREVVAGIGVVVTLEFVFRHKSALIYSTNYTQHIRQQVPKLMAKRCRQRYGMD